MLTTGLISLIVAIPLYSSKITSHFFNRITSVLLIFSALIAYNSIFIDSISAGIGIYSGLFQISTVSQSIEIFIYLLGAIILLGWSTNYSAKIPFYRKKGIIVIRDSNSLNKNYSITDTKKISTKLVPQFPLMIIFTSIGASFLLSRSDLVSMFLSIELQSFAVYILATIYPASTAGLKYFLLGGLSSALILLGTAVIYSYTGVTQLESVFSIITCTISEDINDIMGIFYSSNTVLFGIILIIVGFLFKVAAAPFHNWAPDVYDGVPTIVTSWIRTMPKISIFLFLLEMQIGATGNNFYISENILVGMQDSQIQNLLLICSLLSLIVGTIVGLAQYRIKRLLAFSTISHVGFLLLRLAINTQESIESFIFYLIQYSVTSVNTFLLLLAFGYNIISFSSYSSSFIQSSQEEVEFIHDLKDQFKVNPFLVLRLSLCLFSMAGIPPLMGFFAKQTVLYSSMHNGYYFLSIVAILVSVISASYYLKIIQIMYFPGSPIFSLDSNWSSFNRLSPINKENKKRQLPPKSNDNDIIGRSYINYSTLYNSNTKRRGSTAISNMHRLSISSLTLLIVFFMFPGIPSIIINSCHLLSLSLFNC